MRDPVSINAVAIMVSEPPSSMLRAEPKNRFGRCNALESTPPESTLPDALKSMDYETYRAIRFDPGHALWRGENRKFTAEFFHRGFIYKDRVAIYEVADGRAHPIAYSPDLFSFGPEVKRPRPDENIGFAGFRAIVIIIHRKPLGLPSANQ